MTTTINECPNCSEYLEGDGFQTIFHCPNAEWESYAYNEPDSEPVFCATSEEYDKTLIEMMAEKGRKVAELLGTTLHSFDPGYTFGSTGMLTGNMHLPEHVVDYIYKQHIELEQWRQLSVIKY